MSLDTTFAFGRLFIDVEGTELDAADRRLLAHPAVGGIVLFARNYTDPEQLQELCSDIRATRDTRLVIAVDHEGGRVQRFIDGFTTLPAAGRIGQQHEPNPTLARDLARASGVIAGFELARAGIDVNFSPVVDLAAGNDSVIGARAYHRDPTVVIELSGAYLDGILQSGVLGVAKHFPGHGSAIGDTHLAATRDARDAESISATDLAVYRALIRHGLPALLTSHIVYPAVDPRPAGYSEHWIGQVARASLGFRGLIFTDDLTMQAAGQCEGRRLDADQRVAQAIDAGCDFALLCNDRDGVERVTNDAGLCARLARRTAAVAPSRDRRLVRALQEDYEGARRLIECV